MATQLDYVVHCLVDDCNKCSGVYRDVKTGRTLLCKCTCHKKEAEST
jgi:hypothetical protein